MADLSDQIQQSAIDPQSVSVDGQSVTANRVNDVIRADQYLATKAAYQGRRRGISFSKLIAPGTLSDNGRPSPLEGFP